ncbi:MAG: hypothetical protein CV045_11215 [Cyanobacteria bacterium M5B4]|nr:MAG: hypothetical protein CV045_11215 [Cyanobacteria bacterium M5B4]
MADITNEELKNLILSKFAELDKKMEVGFTELRGEIRNVHTELKGDIQALRNELKGDIKEVKGEIKTIEAKLDGFDKRISYQEFASKGVFVTVLGGILLALARFFISFDPKKLLLSIFHLFNSIGIS